MPERRLVLEDMTYREPLPDGCPPSGAEEIIVPRVIYRLVQHNPPLDSDFKSHRAMNPDRIFKSVSECVTRGLSVTSDFDDAVRRLRLPKFRGAMVCRVALDIGAGRIQQTNSPPHHTWWPLTDFDISANCVVT